MNKKLKAISASNSRDFYNDYNNTQSPILWYYIHVYFESGSRKGFFEPLDFLNLLWKQIIFVDNNCSTPDSTMKTLKDLPLNAEEKHILFGFILLGFGGFPIELKEQFDPIQMIKKPQPEYFILKLIEKEFLLFEGNTPEKKFCTKDNNKRLAKGVYYQSNDNTKEIKNPVDNRTDNEFIIPQFKSDAVQTIYDILKDFFSPADQKELFELLNNWNYSCKKLIFKSNGNKLTDTFKKLIEYDFITGCEKQELQEWIIKNFTFLHKQKNRNYIPDTVEKIISRNDYPCKNPLIEIEKGQIQKVHEPNVRKQSKY